MIFQKIDKIKMFASQLRGQIQDDLEGVVENLRTGNEELIDRHKLLSLESSVENISYFTKNENLSRELQKKNNLIEELEATIEVLEENVANLKNDLEKVSQENEKRGKEIELLTENVEYKDKEIQNLIEFKKKKNKETACLDKIKEIHQNAETNKVKLYS